MLTKNLEDALNKQLNAELYSAYLYLSMAAYFESLGLKGFANWMTIQVQEEVSHAMKFYSYLNERSGRVKLIPIEEPRTDWTSPLEVFEDTYKHEQKVTGLINGLLEQAIKEKDYATQNFLQWFIAEQVEEESSADEIRQRLRLIDNSKEALFMLDKELSQRVFTPPQA